MSEAHDGDGERGRSAKGGRALLGAGRRVARPQPVPHRHRGDGPGAEVTAQ